MATTLLQSSAQEIDVLFTLYYTQLIRTKFSPTHVENSILLEYATQIQAFYSKELNNLQEYLDNLLKIQQISYIGWSSQYYKDAHDNKVKCLQSIKDSITDLKITQLLNISLCSSDKTIDEEFSKFLTTSATQQIYKKNDPKITLKTYKSSMK